ncbi:MAG: sulfotransferase family protein [Acidimicrobiia bacterium]
MRIRSIARRLARPSGAPKPPVCPPGSSLGPPDFIGVGAQRSGTTWWYQLIAAHPSVDGSAEMKELQFFLRYWQRPFEPSDAAEYARYFPRAPGHVAGEWSPGYMSHFWIPSLLARAAPNAKLLIQLRDPIERYRSALVLQAETAPLRFPAASTAFRLGCYGSQLDQLLRYFPRDQVLVLQHEQCALDPKRELARTYEYLEIDSGFVPTDIGMTRNEATARKPSLPDDVLAALRVAYEPEVARLRALVPDLDLTLWRNFSPEAS